MDELDARDILAETALQGLMQNTGAWRDAAQLARMSYDMAEAMLAERARRLREDEENQRF